MLKNMNLLDIPKVELHQHLELSIRHDTLRELAPAAGIDVSTEQAFLDHFVITEPMRDLGSVLKKFLDTQKLLSSEEVLERITFEAIEDAHHQGVRIHELRYSPTFVNQGHPHLNFDKIHAAIVRGMQKAEAQYPIAVGLICIIQRILPVGEAEAVTQFAIDNKDTFVGLDLADDEVGFDSKPFAPFFHKAREAGLGITIHSGEADVPNAPRYVMEAIEHLGAQRIGHGLQIHRDEGVMSYLRDNKIPLELCPTSNYITNSISSIPEHPFRKLMEFGVPVTINTDDPGIFNIQLLGEYQLLVEQFALTEEELHHCNDIAARASFIDTEKKQKVWPRAID